MTNEVADNKSIYRIIRERKSIRRYSPQPVSSDILHRLAESARWAPSWSNNQCWQFIFIDDQVVIGKLTRGIMGRLVNAPSYIVACGNPCLSLKKNDQQYYLVDVAVALQQLMLAAAAEGIGTCWLTGVFDEDKLRELLDIPFSWRIVAITPVGYPQMDIQHKLLDFTLSKLIGHNERRPSEDTWHHNSW